MKTIRVNALTKDLSIDKINAEKVLQVMDDYKLRAKAIIEDKKFTEIEKRAKLEVIMDDKVNQLKTLLTEKQLEKIVPTTERTSKIRQ